MIEFLDLQKQAQKADKIIKQIELEGRFPTEKEITRIQRLLVQGFVPMRSLKF